MVMIQKPKAFVSLYHKLKYLLFPKYRTYKLSMCYYTVFELVQWLDNVVEPRRQNGCTVERVINAWNDKSQIGVCQVILKERIYQ
jgi:hypothetical protein